jgi:glycosyl transferase family 10 (putative fucosyltransferase)
VYQGVFRIELPVGRTQPEQLFLRIEKMSQSDDIPAIAVVPYGKWPTRGIAQVSLDELAWPIGRPNRLAKGVVADMQAHDHIVTFPRKPVFLLPRMGVKAQVSVAIVEPDAVHHRYLSWARWLHWRFYKVLTKSAPLLAQIKNGVFYYFGSTFIEDHAEVDKTKLKMASLIASARRDLEGHKLRHETVDYIRGEKIDVDIMGRGYKPFENKADGLAPYRYSVVIENVREQDYFTEKLVDACLCKTVPIYWGAPNIADYFDVRGMIICETADEIRTALANISVSDYQARLKWIKKNRDAATEHAKYIERAAQLIRDSLMQK